MSVPASQSAPVPVMAGQTPKSGNPLARIWKTRELSTLLLLVLEVLFFAWYLWPDGDRRHPFLNGENALLILKYSSIYGIAAIGAAIVIISGGVGDWPECRGAARWKRTSHRSWA